jgi:hypothetical protein
MNEFRETPRSLLLRICPDAVDLSDNLEAAARAIDEAERRHYMVNAESCLDKINDAFKALENLNAHITIDLGLDDTTA